MRQNIHDNTRRCACALAVTMALAGAAGAAESATYTVTVTPLWIPANFPVEYPEAGILTGPHFSGVIGASHDARYSLFKLGRAPSAGLERLSEEGKHSPLDDEIKAAVADGRVGMLVESDPNKDLGNAKQTFSVTVDAKHPLVSLAEMIAPSPDWFAGVADVNLMEGGKFVAERTIEAMAYDSGGDAGTTYKASDADLVPKQPTAMASAMHFAKNGKPQAVARIVFKRN